MAQLRDEEEWARTLVSAVLRVPVEQYDDGSLPGMHDLRILRGNADEALEVTAAADPDSIQLWKLVNGTDERWIEPGLRGGWRVELVPTANAKKLRRDLPSLLAELERQRVDRLETEHAMSAQGEMARALGIVAASQGDTQYPGSIYVLIDQETRNYPAVASGSPRSVASWISAFLGAPERSDVRTKLARSGATRRHVFILVSAFSTAPASLVTVLLHNDEPHGLPPLQLPPEITDVWIASTWALGSGLRWSLEGGWQRFPTKVEVGDDDPR